MMRKNVASQVVSAQLNSRTDGSPVTSGTTTVYVTKDGGTQGAGGGTVAHEGNGCWSYVPTQAETNANHISFTFENSSGVVQTVNIYTVSFDPHDTVRLGLTALPNAAADAAGGLPISDAGGLDLDTLYANVAAILVDTGTTLDGKIDALTVIANAIQAKTDGLPSDPADASVIVAAFTVIEGKLDGLRPKKNTAITSFMFKMVESDDHITPKTGATVSAARSIDGDPFAACANAVSEVGSGWYKITLAASDLNGNVIALKFTATDADQRDILILTQP